MPEPPLFIEQISSLPPGDVGLAVLGQPIVHSLSPEMHNAALLELSRRESKFSRWKYHKIEIAPEHLAQALPRLAELGFRGLNLTIPHKVDVLSILEDIDPRALVMGAVNTLLWKNGSWKGYNTDGEGLSRAVKIAFGKGLNDFNVLILGAGGAARAAAAQCLAEGCQNLAVLNRSADRAQKMIESLRENGFSKRIELMDRPRNPFPGIKGKSLIINATSLGLQMDDPTPLDLSLFEKSVCIYDMIYNPPMTKLTSQAKEYHMPYSNGLGMLVGQAVRSLEIWTGQKVSEDAMTNAVSSF